MNPDSYSQIIALKNERNDAARERYFEQLIREIMPWDHRPPIVAHTSGDQAGVLFGYHGSIYLIASVASRPTIKPGMKEWEEFEQKMHSRHEEETIGLFCCLYEVSEEIVQIAGQLNQQGAKIIIISGSNWEDLHEINLYFPAFLEYMTLNCVTNDVACASSLTEANKWIYDTKVIDERLNSTSKRSSAPFLRRFKHKFHEKIFVDRNIDKQVLNLVETVRPLHLKARAKKDTARQIIVVRDYSGSGKTTLSTNFASGSDYLYCIAFTANLTPIDKILKPFFEQLSYPGFAINELLAVDKPLLLIIDSLDETPVQMQIQKRKEIKSLLKNLDELNTEAVKYKLAMYPIIVMFTVREDYWRDWESTFEGRQDVAEFKKMITSYNTHEFQKALPKYEQAYDYSITNHLNREAIGILSIPINLEIFSEANHYEGDISIYEIWEGNILSSFFNKKEELINKHYIDQFTETIFYRVLGLTAFELLREKTTLFTKARFRQIVETISTPLGSAADKIMLQLISEQIITNDTEESKNYRFKYNRFIEYLAAFFIIQEVERTADYTHIDDFIKVIYDSNMISIFSVFNNLKHIAKTRYGELEEEIIKYYARSETYLSHYLPELRGRIARGERISESNIKDILINIYEPSAFNSWHIFFIISASHYSQGADVLLSSFKMAWENNKESGKRWQLIQNMAKREMLVLEAVLLTLLGDGTPRDWEEYLGQIIEQKANNTFMELWLQIGGERALGLLSHNNPEEWQLTNRLLDLITRHESFMPGDVWTDIPSTPYKLFEPKKNKKKFNIPEREQQFLDELVSEIKECLEGVVPRPTQFAGRYNDMSKEAGPYLNQEMEEIVNAVYGPSGKPFINHLLTHFSEHFQFIRVILEVRILHYELQAKDNGGRTAFMELIEHAQHKQTFLELLFIRGYRKNPEDDRYLYEHISQPDLLNNKELEDLVLGYCYYKVNFADLHKLSNISRPLNILFSFKFNRIISFRFTKMIQVVNQALESYGEYERLFIRALEEYGLHDEMYQIPSFRRKVNDLKTKRISPNHQFDSLFEAIFPFLFQ